MSLQCLSKLSPAYNTSNTILTKALRIFSVPLTNQQGKQNVSSCTVCEKKNLLVRCTSFRRRSAPPFALNSHITSTTALKYSTIADDDKGVLGRMWQGLGFTGKLRYKKYILQNAGLRLYLCCVELIDYPKFFEVLQLPDTFNSWFKITELHVWMAMVRLAHEGNEGKFVRNSMVRFLWDDVEKRSKKLGNNVSSSQRRDGVHILSEQFRAALLSYDEGLIDDDRVLGGAIWRNLFDQNCSDLAKVEFMVQYIRKQIHHLEQQESGVLLTSGLAQFVPLVGDEDKQRNKQILNEILKRI